MTRSRSSLDEFRRSLAEQEPPPGAPPLLRALWYDAKGDWERAHEIAQEESGSLGSLVHAYLHRKEGDTENAAYWYRRARRTACAAPLDEEWSAIAAELLLEGR